jgi:hypothetical protein
MAAKLRWRIAYWLNRFSRFCWADLVAWALDGESYQLTRSYGGKCRSESVVHRDRSCWCGKFQNGCRSREDGA